MKSLREIFKVNNPIIAMIHFPPLIGYEKYPGLSFIIKKTLDEVSYLNNSGVHSIMVENNYDIPHKEFVDPEVTSMMTLLTDLVVKNTSLPVGVNVLWNDYRSALGVCASTGAKYFRVPAFVDDVRTAYGVMEGTAGAVIAYRKKLGLENIAIFADVQVKHSEMIDRNKPLSLSIKQAYEKGADSVIITGKWTGDAPKMDDLKEARRIAGKRPVLVGSGSTKKNLGKLLDYADGVIVGTAIMTENKVDRNKLMQYLKAYDSCAEIC